MENRKIEVGEKFLSISIVGLNKPLVAFKNKDKKEGSNQPDFKSDGVAIWIRKKKEELLIPDEEEI